MEHIPVRHIDAPHKGPALLNGFRIRTISSMLNGKTVQQSLHRHDFYFMLVLQKGDGKHEIDFTSHRLADRQIFFMRPGQVHQLQLNLSCTGYLLEFKEDFYSFEKLSNELLQKVRSNNVYQSSATRFEKMTRILSGILDEFSNKEERYLQAIQNNLSGLFIELLRERNSKDNKTSNANKYSQERLEQFLNLLHTHIFEHKQVSAYAELLNLSSYQLNSITKSTLGKTCSAVIDEYTILESKCLLLATSNQVTQIAYSLGYEDVSYFIRYFKKHTGQSPEAFRNNFR